MITIKLTELEKIHFEIVKQKLALLQFSNTYALSLNKAERDTLIKIIQHISIDPVKNIPESPC